MSIPVELPALKQQIAEVGAGAFLVTVTDEATPHVVSVVVRWDGDRIAVDAGRRTRANLAARPTATLLWPPVPDAAYNLIVDATADAPGADDQPVTLRPDTAVLHRVAGTPGDGPSCVAPGAA